MPVISVVGFDPGFASFGMVKARVSLLPKGVGNIVIETAKLVETSRSKNKQVRHSSDGLRRCSEILEAMHAFCSGAAFGFAEVPNGGAKSAAAMRSMGIATALLASCPIPLIEVSPMEVKLATAGDKQATKETMISWAMRRHPEAEWLAKARNGQLQFIAKNEHLADAICAVHAGLASPAFRQSLALLASALNVAA